MVSSSTLYANLLAPEQSMSSSLVAQTEVEDAPLSSMSALRQTSSSALILLAPLQSSLKSFALPERVHSLAPEQSRVSCPNLPEISILPAPLRSTARLVQSRSSAVRVQAPERFSSSGCGSDTFASVR